MGWASGEEVFDPVAWALVDAGASDEILDLICTKLAEALMDQGWDTEDESIAEFQGHPVVQHALRKAQKELDLDDEDLASVMRWAPQGDQPGRWQLYTNGPDDPPHGTAEGTWKGFNSLIRQWANLPGSDGVVSAERSEAAGRYLLR